MVSSTSGGVSKMSTSLSMPKPTVEATWEAASGRAASNSAAVVVPSLLPGQVVVLPVVSGVFLSALATARSTAMVVRGVA